MPSTELVATKALGMDKTLTSVNFVPGVFPALSAELEPRTFVARITPLLLGSPPFPLLSRVYFLPAYDWGNHAEPSRLQLTSKFRLGHGGKIPCSCELVRLESLGGRRGPRFLVLLGLAPRRRQGNIILVCMQTSNFVQSHVVYPL
jgi:hypothetical protein